MESNSNYKENSNNIFDIFQNENNSKSHEGDLSKSEQIYGDKKNISSYNRNFKEELSFFSEEYQNQTNSIFGFISRKIDEMINKLKSFKEYSKNLKTLSFEQISNSNNNIIKQDNNNNVTREEIKKAQSFDNNTIEEISFQIDKLDTQINSNFEIIKEKLSKIKSSIEKSHTEKEESVEIINLNSESNLSSIEKIEKIIAYRNSNSDMQKEIFIQQAESKFGLDNQFEFVKYNKNNDLLIYINNHNDLILKLINKENNEIINNLIYKNIFPDDIREIRYYSKNFKINDDEEQFETKNFLLVSSQKNELKVFKVLKHNIKNFENVLEEINHITNIYQRPSNFMSQDFFDLSSCVIRFNKSELDESEIYTTCWEGNSIKVFNILLKECKTEIISKTSCNIKFCEIVEEKYLVFCGCNKQDNFTCVNCIDLDKIDFTKEKNNEVNFIKYKDESEENKENVHFNLSLYKAEEKKYLIDCDEKGYLRLFNFDNQELIYKIYPSIHNKKFKYDEKNYKIRRLNSIINWKKNLFLITERNTGYIFLIEINASKDIKIQVKDCFYLFNTEVISVRKYRANEFLVLGKDVSDEESNINPVEMIKKVRINYND